jgi:hypothetical protein
MIFGTVVYRLTPFTQTIKSDRSGYFTHSFDTSPHHLLDLVYIRTQSINNHHPKTTRTGSRAHTFAIPGLRQLSFGKLDERL